MSNPEEIPRVKILDEKGEEREVRSGDLVKLLPVSMPKRDGSYITQTHYDFLKEWLGGEGPFTISWIGRWPCGGVNLYLSLPKGRGPGAKSYDFVYVEGER